MSNLLYITTNAGNVVTNEEKLEAKDYEKQGSFNETNTKSLIVLDT